MSSGLANAGNGVGKGVACPLHMVRKADVMDPLGQNSAFAINQGSNDGLVVSECRGVVEGIS